MEVGSMTSTLCKLLYSVIHSGLSGVLVDKDEARASLCRRMYSCIRILGGRDV